VRYPSLKLAAKDESCISCGANDGTVVLAHRNEGKGMGIKAPDYWALDLCATCHREYDQGSSMTRSEKRAWFNLLYPKQVERWIKKGLITIK
jgi:hypothetical protein